jgi:hypothetical protein
VGEVAEELCNCCGNGVLGRDGHIYAADSGAGGVLQIDTANNTYSFVGDYVEDKSWSYDLKWGDPIVGNDNCIYWPPVFSECTLKYDIEEDFSSLKGDYFGEIESRGPSCPGEIMRIGKWMTGAVAPDGAIHCIPYDAGQVLAIDPFKAFVKELKEGEEIFRNPPRIEDKTVYESAITKFGRERTFQIIEECFPNDEVCGSFVSKQRSGCSSLFVEEKSIVGQSHSGPQSVILVQEIRKRKNV